MKRKPKSNADSANRKDLIDELFNEGSSEFEQSLKLESDQDSGADADQAATVPVRTHNLKTEILPQPVLPSAVNSDTVKMPVQPTAKASIPQTGSHFDADLERLLKTEIAPIRTAGDSNKSRASEAARGPNASASRKNAESQSDLGKNAESFLRHAEGLKSAQSLISKLESELEAARTDAESFRSAAMAFEKRLDEMTERYHHARSELASAQELHKEEKSALREISKARDLELQDLRARLAAAEERIQSGFGQVRNRERELEHRIEMIKTESQLLTAGKDKQILDLRKQIDALKTELNQAKSQAQEIGSRFREKQETVQRAVRALRLASTVLETADEEDDSKKTGS